jgi:hypothetical protein
MIGSDSGHRLYGMVGLQQRAADEMHSPQCEIADWPHSKVLFAGSAERPFRCADGFANFRQIELTGTADGNVTLKNIWLGVAPRDRDSTR